MFNFLIDDLLLKWRDTRKAKGLYEYTNVTTDSWNFLLIKGPEDYYHFIIFIKEDGDNTPLEIEGEITEEEQCIKDILDEMVDQGWTMIGLQVIEHLSEINPSHIVLERIEN